MVKTRKCSHELDKQIIERILAEPSDPGRNVTCVRLSVLNKWFPDKPYSKLYRSVRRLAASSEIKILHRGRLLVCCVPKWVWQPI